MFDLSAKEFSDKYYNENRKAESDRYYSLDCRSGEGLINPLLRELKKKFIGLEKKFEKQRKEDFEFYLEFFFKKCININRSFSDAIEFFSIWLNLSPDTLLSQLKEVRKIKKIKALIEKLEDLQKEPKNRSLVKELNIKRLDIKNLIGKLKNRKQIEKPENINLKNKLDIKNLIQRLDNINLKNFFNRTEYDHDGDKWYFQELLLVFKDLVKEEGPSANEILDYLFETLDFFSMPEIFVREIIGYDRLECCIKESPEIFKQALLLKVYEFVVWNKTSDIGLNSHKYLNTEIQAIDPTKRKEIEKKIDRLQLASSLQNGGLFIYPSIKNFNPSDSSVLFQSNYKRGCNY